MSQNNPESCAISQFLTSACAVCGNTISQEMQRNEYSDKTEHHFSPYYQYKANFNLRKRKRCRVRTKTKMQCFAHLNKLRYPIFLLLFFHSPLESQVLLRSQDVYLAVGLPISWICFSVFCCQFLKLSLNITSPRKFTSVASWPKIG